MKSYLESLSGIREIHDLHVWNINSNDIFMISHVIIDKTENVEELIKRLNKSIEDKYNIHHTSFQIVTEKCC
jgi:cobalt-zinc-cadmium efflux system protein